MPKATTVKVAIRVRPFNKRELGQEDNKLIIKMENNSVSVLNPV
jgi:hypothetical protein